MKIYDMKVNHLVNPLGFSLSPLSLSYKIDVERGARQKSARVVIESAGKTVYDSGVRADIDSLSFVPDIALAPRTKYVWRVTVETDAGDTITSPDAWFETGKMSEKWAGEWIAADQAVESARLFTRFSLPGNAVSARLYICGLGLYEAEINGRRVGDEYLAPGCNNYPEWLQYQTYDVTALLAEENDMSVILGDGWYKGRFCFLPGKKPVGDTQCLICEIRATLSDGREIIVKSDESWGSEEARVRFSNIYDGEVYDASYQPAKVYGTRRVSPVTDNLTERLSPPVRIMDTLAPVAVFTTPRGETVLDMGQVMTGWLTFRARGEKGHVYHLQYGEVLQDDCFYTDNLRSAKQEFTYISDGQETWARPHFTFYGFRYVKLDGFERADIHDFKGCVLYSDMPRTAWVETSNEKVNRLALNTLWGQRGNFLDVPTDCPQRDERMGWTGDAQAFCATACYQMDTAAFYTKYLYDMLTEQNIRRGAVPHVVPSCRVQGEPSCAWADAAAIIPWTVYLFYGDQTLLSCQYLNMRGWVEWLYALDERTGGGRLWRTGFHFADWLALDAAFPTSCTGGTDRYYIASCYYLYSTRLTAKAAKVLNNLADYEKYSKLADEILSAIRTEYLTKTGRLALSTQTAYVLALFLGIVNEKEAPAVRAALDKALEDSQGALRTGFVGTAYLCRVLSRNGMNPWAYSLFLREEYPSWLYEVNMGATTVWERWNSILPDGHMSDTGMNSLNHYAYGAIMEWLYRDAAGIAPDESAPGFRRAIFTPRPDARLNKVSFRFDSPVGTYESAWEITGDKSMVWRVRVPFGGEGVLRLPKCRATGAAFRDEGALSVARVTAGAYEIHCEFEESPWRAPTLERPMQELWNDQELGERVRAAAPALETMMRDPIIAGRHFRQVRSDPFSELPADQYLALEKVLLDETFGHIDA